MLTAALIGCAHSDVVHVELPDDTAKEDFTEKLKAAQDEIYDWFEYDQENLYRLLYALERIKRKFRIDFDEYSVD